MTIDRHSDPDKKEVITDPDELALREAENGVKQFNEILRIFREARAINESGNRWKLRHKTILELHHAALEGISELAGTYRNTGMKISGSDHQPPHFTEVPEYAQDLCDYINDNWDKRTAVQLSAYVMWRLNWIHPFVDGNGRTARALSYLILLVKLGAVLPGTPTIPEQIAADKGPYYDALEAADSMSTPANPDVSSLAQLLESMLINQLTLTPNLPNTSKDRLRKVFTNRLSAAPADLRRVVFGAYTLHEQLWTIGSSIVLQVTSQEGITRATDRYNRLSSPFPYLVVDAESKQEAAYNISSENSGVILQEAQYILESKYLLCMHRDSYVTVVRPNLMWKGEGIPTEWSCEGALYLVQLGTSVTDNNIDETFDLMIAKHLRLAELSLRA